MSGRKRLLDLNAAAMTVHVAESTNVHENVKAELLTGAESAQHLVMASTMANTGIDDCFALLTAHRLDAAPDLPIWIRAMLIEQSRSQLHVERFVLKQIDGAGRLNGRVVHQLGSHLPQFA